VLTLFSRVRRSQFCVQLGAKLAAVLALQEIRNNAGREIETRPEGLVLCGASAALRRLAVEQPRPAQRALHPSPQNTNASRENSVNTP
jgi:hypothetical protein